MIHMSLPNEIPHRDTMTMFRTPLQDFAAVRASTKRLAEVFHIAATPKDVGWGLELRQDELLLQTFYASNSVRWTNWSREVSEPAKAVELPAKNRCGALAAKVLQERGLADDRATLETVTYTEISRQEAAASEPIVFPAQIHANFRYALDGLRVLGPGAKARVTLGDRAEVTGVLRFWREAVADHVLPVITAEHALELLLRDHMFAELSDDTASASLAAVELSYYALPPREVQGFLLPVYAMKGTVSTPKLKAYEFRRYVIAVSIPAKEAKRMGAAHRVDRLIL